MEIYKKALNWLERIPNKILLAGLATILLTTCSLLKDPSVTITYPGMFDADMRNEDGGILRVYYSASNKESRTWTQSDLEAILGELKNLEVYGIKVLGDSYSDKGNLTASIMEGWDVVAEDTAPIGTPRAFVKHSF